MAYPDDAAAAFADRSWQTAPIADLAANFAAATDAKNWPEAQKVLNQLQSRLYAAKAEEEPKP